jgi:hypothetical protein
MSKFALIFLAFAAGEYLIRSYTAEQNQAEKISSSELAADSREILFDMTG